MRMRHKIPLTLLLASTVLPAAAQDRPASTDSVYACAAIEADDARLACYDEAVGALKQAEEAGGRGSVGLAEGPAPGLLQPGYKNMN